MDSTRVAIETVRETLNRANHAYYVLQSPIMSDIEYDDLLRELTELENAHPEYKSELSPTELVGGGFSPDLRKIPHKTRMMSLDNIYTKEEFDLYGETLKRNGINPDTTVFYCDLKMDGISLALTYSDYNLKSAASRGDGSFGEDLTENCLDLIGGMFPETLISANWNSPSPSLGVRGECTISSIDFISVNRRLEEAGEKQISSPRHMVSAFLRTQKQNRSIDIGKIIQFSVYGADDMSPKNPYGWKTHFQMIEDLRYVFNTIPGVLVKGMSQVWEYYKKIEETRHSFKFEIDGIVFRINDFSTQDQLGVTSKVPKYAMAVKFKAQRGSSVVKDVIFQVGRSGILTPVLVVSPPVILGGVSVSRATLHNPDFISQLDLRIGDTVVIERSGDVIPKVIEVDTTKRQMVSAPLDLPTDCPVCGYPVIKKPGQVGIFCSNSICPSVLVEKMRFVASRDCYDLVGFGSVMIENLCDRGILTRASDFFRLTLDQLVSTGFGKKRAENCKNVLDSRKKSLTLDKLILGLCISGIGKTTARLLSTQFSSLYEFESATYLHLVGISSVGDTLANEILEYIKEHKGFAQEYEKLGLNVTRQSPISFQRDTSNFFYEKKFEITGRFNLSRSDLVKRLEDLGAMHTSIAQADILLQGDDASSAKINKAREKGLPILSPSQLYPLL